MPSGPPFLVSTPSCTCMMEVETLPFHPACLPHSDTRVHGHPQLNLVFLVIEVRGIIWARRDLLIDWHCGTRSIRVTWELVRNAASQAPA